MKKAQARRLALWTNGNYMMAADHSGIEDDLVSDEQHQKILSEQASIGHDMIKRSGIPYNVTQEEALRMVLAGERVMAD